MYVCMYVCMDGWMYVCVYVCMCVCVYHTTGTLRAFNSYSTITNLSVPDEYGDSRFKKKGISHKSPHTKLRFYQKEL
jgi:hypothetical protein